MRKRMITLLPLLLLLGSLVMPGCSFNKENPDSQITEAVVANDVPPRITTKLAKGKITFEDFLVEVQTYLGKGKAVKQEKTAGQPDLSELGGGDKASEHAVLTDADSSYENVIF